MVTEIRSVMSILTGRQEDHPAHNQPDDTGAQLDQQTAAVDPKVPPDAAQAAEETLNELLADMLPPGACLMIEHDQAANRFVYKSVDRDTGEVLRQWPSQEVIRKLAHLREVSGLTVDGRV